jgi:hypothetical protein
MSKQKILRHVGTKARESEHIFIKIKKVTDDADANL